MKKYNVMILAVLIALGCGFGCKPQDSKTTGHETPPAQPPVAQQHSTQQPAAQSPAAEIMTGTVLETMDSGSYTYVQVDTKQGKIWAAAPNFEIKVGETVTVPPGLPMANYHSKSLDRDFEVVYFVPNVQKGETAQAVSTQPKLPAGHPPMGGVADAAKSGTDLSGIEKAGGGLTVEEIFSSQAELSGKEVVVRGKVVKFSPQIMGSNWIHLRDGTGSEGTNDLTVTTSDTVKVGDTVLVTGMVATNKDFGAGYKYDVIVEKAKVAVE